MSKSIGTGFEKVSVTYYFGYGSNMNEARVAKREMPFVEVLAGQLHGYELRFNKRSVKYPGAASANVQQTAGAVVEGVGRAVMGLPDRTPLIDHLGRTALSVLREARDQGITPFEAAEQLALRRLEKARRKA